MRNFLQWSRMAAVAALVGTVGCKSLEVTNPNAPDASRAFSDPAAVAGLLTGGLHNWYYHRGGYYGVATLVGMADSYTSSWNNGQYRYYFSVGPVGYFQSNCPNRCGWYNDPSDAKKNPIEDMWYGYYSILSSVNDVLTAIRTNHVVLTDGPTTKMHESIAVMVQGVVFMNIALNYDKGFYVTEATDISKPAAIPFRPRKEMRDSAISTLKRAIVLLTATPFAASPTEWTGTGVSYSSAQWIKLIHTMEAELLAYYPRNPTEPVDWSEVRNQASQGLSSGAGFTFNIFKGAAGINDFERTCGGVKCLFRVHTNIDNLITGGYGPARGPGPVYRTPYSAPVVNPSTTAGCVRCEPQPNSADARLGDGTWGPTDNYSKQAGKAATANAGTDFAWSPREPFRAVRNPEAQSSLVYIRYSYLTYASSGLPGETGNGLDPIYPATLNDLLWAEADLKGATGGSPAEAAQLINKTRVGRGHLAPVTAGDGTATLTRAMEYESEIELFGSSADAFYNRRRATPTGFIVGGGAPCPAINCLRQGTPREMPVPAKELLTLLQPVYTWGGPGINDQSAPSGPAFSTGSVMWNSHKTGAAPTKSARPGSGGTQ